MTTRRRPGYALIELLVVMTVTAVMLGLCAGMIHLLMRLDRSGRTASDESADLARLARDFRADVHASSKDPGRSNDRMTLTIDGGPTVEYQARPHDILRTVRDGEKVRRFETYRRPARTSITYQLDSAGPRPIAILTIDRPSDARDDSSYRDYRIEAELGKDRRLNPRAE
jgi:type II secretory pathway component PulJ